MANGGVAAGHGSRALLQVLRLPLPRDLGGWSLPVLSSPFLRRLNAVCAGAGAPGRRQGAHHTLHRAHKAHRDKTPTGSCLGTRSGAAPGSTPLALFSPFMTEILPVLYFLRAT